MPTARVEIPERLILVSWIPFALTLLTIRSPLNLEFPSMKNDVVPAPVENPFISTWYTGKLVPNPT